MKRILLHGVLAMSLFSFSANAFAISEAGVLFLMIAPGARAAGMGEAFVAVADDATATYWNPAGLAYQEGREIGIMHSNWLPQFGSDLFYDYLTYHQDVAGLGDIGLSVTYINLGKQVRTLEDSPEPVGEFSAYEYAIGASYGTKITNNLALGVSLKYIQSNLAPVGAGSERGDGKGSSFAVDVGVLYNTGLVRGLSLGANLSNVGPKIAYIDQSQASPLPTNLKFGLAWKAIDQEFNKLTFAADANKLLVVAHREGPADPVYRSIFKAWYDQPQGEEWEEVIWNAGAEYWYGDLIAMRAGYHYDKVGDVKYITFGAGLKYSLYEFDFGYINAPEGHPLSDTMRFSLGIGF